jgi:O-antigen/teichoic acid export membrane protein
LSPIDYGIYAIVTFLIVFLGAFGGTGLSANLIREHPEPPPQVFRTVYSFQQVVVVICAIAIWVISNDLAKWYRLSIQQSWVFRLTALALIATTWMVPPQIEMERNLEFHKLALVEVAQAFSFNLIAVLLAYAGFGAISFGIALLVRSILGAILANLIQPVSLGWSFYWSVAKPHLKFGLFYQTAQIVSLIKDSITPILIGFMVGTAAVGYISWAAMLAGYPVLALVVLQRLYLPVFARFQNDSKKLGSFLEQTIWATYSFTAPFSIFLLVLVHPITRIIFGVKWEPAIILFFFFWTANVFVPAAGPVQSMLNSIGKSQVAMVFAIMWMVLTWAFGWPLAIWKGALGIAIATALVQFSNLVLFWVAKSHVPFRIIRSAFRPWLLSLAVGGLLYPASRYWNPMNIGTLIAEIAASLTAYLAASFWIDRARFSKLLQLVRQ